MPLSLTTKGFYELRLILSTTGKFRTCPKDLRVTLKGPYLKIGIDSGSLSYLVKLPNGCPFHGM